MNESSNLLPEARGPRPVSLPMRFRVQTSVRRERALYVKPIFISLTSIRGDRPTRTMRDKQSAGAHALIDRSIEISHYLSFAHDRR
jgi:hypothetical protein